MKIILNDHWDGSSANDYFIRLMEEHHPREKDKIKLPELYYLDLFYYDFYSKLARASFNKNDLINLLKEFIEGNSPEIKNESLAILNKIEDQKLPFQQK